MTGDEREYDRLGACDPATGEVDFQFPWRATKLESVNASSPVVVGDEVFVSEAYGPGSALLKLKAEGYDVVTASDGLAGLVEVSTSPPALVLLDLVMPDLGGVRVLEEMRDDPELVDVPVIVVTGKIDAVPAMRELLGDERVGLLLDSV